MTLVLSAQWERWASGHWGTSEAKFQRNVQGWFVLPLLSIRMVVGVHERVGMYRHKSRACGDADCAMSFCIREHGELIRHC